LELATAGNEVQQAMDQQHQLAAGLYRSAARVVLLGHGADEQCGGYGRHRTK
jgi:asparagine synthetase B (glutamine-hydrolysing)